MSEMNETPVFDPGVLYTDREASGPTKIAIATLRNWRALGIGPRFLKLGKRCVRYQGGDLNAFIAGQPKGSI